MSYDVIWHLIPSNIVLAREEDVVTIFSYLSGMYGWIVDGISSLFEPISGQKHAEWPEEGNSSAEVSTRTGVKGANLQSQSRAAKRNYQRSAIGENDKYLYYKYHNINSNNIIHSYDPVIFHVVNV